MKHNIVWSIAGSDSSGCAGIQADMKTFNSLGVHGCTVITAVTAQSNRQLSDIQFIDIKPQLATMQKHFYPHAIKIGMLGNSTIIDSVTNFLKTYTGMVILDPVMVTTSGGNLFTQEVNQYVTHLQKLFRQVDLLTPNLPEAEMLLNYRISSFQEMVQAAHDILKLGVKSVLIKGGHFKQDSLCQDYWTNGVESCWLASKRNIKRNYSGTGCTLSSAIAACCALGYDIKDAIVIAKMYVNQAMRLSVNEGVLIHLGWPENEIDLPYVDKQPLTILPTAFPDCGPRPLGLYPIVDNIEWLKKLLPLGVKTIQLRIKEKSDIELEHLIHQAIVLAKQYDARLFINDHWELAIRCGAYGAHLGQNDLLTADINKIHAAGLRLGISTHCYYEIAHAHTFRPSYIACGPIFHTQTKDMTVAPQGIEQLIQWRRMLNYPLIAIGGINIDRLRSVLEAEVDGVALISAITQAPDPLIVTQNLLATVNEYVTYT